MRGFVIMATASLLISPAMAQTAQQAPQTPAPATKTVDNPNEIVCQKEEVTGSRIASKRVCMTRAQWAQRQTDDRAEIERVQTQRGCTKNGC